MIGLFSLLFFMLSLFHSIYGINEGTSNIVVRHDGTIGDDPAFATGSLVELHQISRNKSKRGRDPSLEMEAIDLFSKGLHLLNEATANPLGNNSGSIVEALELLERSASLEAGAGSGAAYASLGNYYEYVFSQEPQPRISSLKWWYDHILSAIRYNGKSYAENRLLDAKYDSSAESDRLFMYSLRAYVRAAGLGNETGHSNLGVLYSHGLFGLVPQLDPLSLIHFELASRSGDILSQLAMSRRYQYGHGVPRNCTRAVMYLLDAAYSAIDDHESRSLPLHAPTMIHFLDDSLLDSLSPNSNDKQLVSFYKEESNKGKMDATMALAHIFLYGAKGQMQDPSEAAKYLHIAAQSHEPTAMAMLGHLYLYGLGVPRSPSIAYAFLLPPARQGNPYAMNTLGVMFMNSTGHVSHGSNAADHPEIAREVRRSLFKQGGSPNIVGVTSSGQTVTRTDSGDSVPIASFSKKFFTPTPYYDSEEATVASSRAAGPDNLYDPLLAMELFQRASTLGLPDAHYNLGLASLRGFYQFSRTNHLDTSTGETTPPGSQHTSSPSGELIHHRRNVPDLSAALRHFQQAAAAGHIAAMARTGQMKFMGLGTAADCSGALVALRGAVTSGYGASSAGSVPRQALETGEALVRRGRILQGALQFARAAAVGSEVGAWNLAFLYDEGLLFSALNELQNLDSGATGPLDRVSALFEKEDSTKEHNFPSKESASKVQDQGDLPFANVPAVISDSPTSMSNVPVPVSENVPVPVSPSENDPADASRTYSPSAAMSLLNSLGKTPFVADDLVDFEFGYDHDAPQHRAIDRARSESSNKRSNGGPRGLPASFLEPSSVPSAESPETQGALKSTLSRLFSAVARYLRATFVALNKLTRKYLRIDLRNFRPPRASPVPPAHKREALRLFLQASWLGVVDADVKVASILLSGSYLEQNRTVGGPALSRKMKNGSVALFPPPASFLDAVVSFVSRTNSTHPAAAAAEVARAEELVQRLSKNAAHKNEKEEEPETDTHFPVDRVHLNSLSTASFVSDFLNRLTPFQTLHIAFERLRGACSNNVARACFDLAWLYERGLPLGISPPSSASSSSQFSGSGVQEGAVLTRDIHMARRYYDRATELYKLDPLAQTMSWVLSTRIFYRKELLALRTKVIWPIFSSFIGSSESKNGADASAKGMRARVPASGTNPTEERARGRTVGLAERLLALLDELLGLQFRGFPYSADVFLAQHHGLPVEKPTEPMGKKPSPTVSAQAPSRTPASPTSASKTEQEEIVRRVLDEQNQKLPPKRQRLEKLMKEHYDAKEGVVRGTVGGFMGYVRRSLHMMDPFLEVLARFAMYFTVPILHVVGQRNLAERLSRENHLLIFLIGLFIATMWLRVLLRIRMVNNRNMA